MSESTRGLLRALLAVGYAGGAVLVILLLAKGSADALSARVGITVLSMIVLSLIGAAGFRLLERPTLDSLWGYATLLVAVATFILIIVEAWREGHLPNESRVAAMIVISILFGGGSLVLSGEHESEEQAVRTTRNVALLALVALGTLTILALSDVHIGARWFGVAATVFLVSALSLPVLRLAVDEGS
jgi:hypothetical protein